MIDQKTRSDDEQTPPDEQLSSHKQLSAPSDLLTVAEVGRILRWDATTVRRHISSGAIPAWAVVPLPHRGKRISYRLKRAWLERLLSDTQIPTGRDEPPPIVC
jgi:hypothetical protein